MHFSSLDFLGCWVGWEVAGLSAVLGILHPTNLGCRNGPCPRVRACCVCCPVVPFLLLVSRYVPLIVWLI